jgi:hypothetical protein
LALSDSTSREPRGSATRIWGVDAVVMLGRASAYLNRPVLVNRYLATIAANNISAYTIAYVADL